ncbi:MAG: hypothetical protein ACTSO9_00950 [Candidatus Helarchaeota archaeon]
MKCSEIFVWIGNFINQIEADFFKLIAINYLKQTKHMISLLHWLGSISAEDTQLIKGKIDNKIGHLKTLI